MPFAFEARNITQDFGALRALSDVSLTLQRGEVHAVIGENGAGKSTLMNIISGKLRPSRGTLWRNGSEVRLHSPRDGQACGIGIAPQEINLVDQLTVAENIMLGNQIFRASGLLDWTQTRAAAARHLRKIDTSIDVDAKIGSLNKAQQQLVQIARAVAASVEVLIFDEPTASLSSKETVKLYEFVREFVRGGNSIFYISHRLDEVAELSDRITVLRDGHHVGELKAGAINKDEMVRLMAGRDIAARIPTARSPGNADVVLRVNNLSRTHEFTDISFDLRKGEVLGFAGLVGAGRTELAKCLFGLTQPSSGSFELFGRPQKFAHPADAIAKGLVYLPEERKQEGIFPLLSIAENMAIAAYDRFAGGYGLRFDQIRKAVSDSVQRLKIKIGTVSDAITSLSGGNQQKVIIGRWLLKESRLLILDEPTRGIDVGAKAEINQVLHQLTQAGLTIIYISSELQEILDVSDRVVVMHEGRLKGIVDASSATQEGLLALAMS